MPADSCCEKKDWNCFDILFEIAGAKVWYKVPVKKLLGSWTAPQIFRGRFGALFKFFASLFASRFVMEFKAFGAILFCRGATLKITLRAKKRKAKNNLTRCSEEGALGKKVAWSGRDGKGEGTRGRARTGEEVFFSRGGDFVDAARWIASWVLFFTTFRAKSSGPLLVNF